MSMTAKLPNNRGSYSGILHLHAISIALMIFILAFDLALPLGVAGGVPYVAVVLVGWWYPRLRYTAILAMLSCILVLVGYYSSPMGGVPWMVFMNRSVAIFAILITAILVIISKRTAFALHQSQSRLEKIIDLTPEAVITIDTEMVIQLFNQGAERIFGYQSDEIIGHSMDILMPKRFRMGHQKHVSRFEALPNNYLLMDTRDEIKGLRKDGTEFPASASVAKTEIDGEHIYTVVLYDISERQRYEDERRRVLGIVEKANKAKSEFMASMSHELRTPLNAILGFSEMIALQKLGPIQNGQYLEYANDINISGLHLLAMVNDILDIERIEAGKYELRKEGFLASDVVNACSLFLKQRAEEKGVSLTINLVEPLPLLNADKRAIMQVLINLLTNAVKFTPEHGEVALEARASKKNFIFIVRDNGIGVPAEKIPLLKDPFVRHKSNPNEPQDGVGLGLAISNSLVDIHGGTLEIESTLGKGTTITVTLPNSPENL